MPHFLQFVALALRGAAVFTTIRSSRRSTNYRVNPNRQLAASKDQTDTLRRGIMRQPLNSTFHIAAVLASALPILGLLAYERTLAEVTPPAALAAAPASSVQVLSPIIVTAKRIGGAEARLQDKASATGA
jgi:hypothetical protein